MRSFKKIKRFRVGKKHLKIDKKVQNAHSGQQEEG
jgi:hypothetical protein